MHFQRSRLGVALVGAVAVAALCSSTLPAFAVDRDLDSGPSLTAAGPAFTPSAMTASGSVGAAAPRPAGMVGRGGGTNNSGFGRISVGGH